MHHDGKMSALRFAAVLGWMVALTVGCGSTADQDSAAADTAFSALQARGAAAMGVDQYTSAHVFEALTDGGRIVLQRQEDDPEGTATIRAHMADIASRFGAGDFSIPGFVHDQKVPGTDVMTERASLISYAVDPLPRGGQVRLTTTDSAAIAAIHDFLGFQRHDHRASGH